MRLFRTDGMARAGVTVSLGLLAACSRQPAAPPSADRIAVVAPATPAPIAKPSGARATPEPTAPVAPSPAQRMQPHKAFVDPPLPPELRDDGGLIPLPPPPTPTSDAR